MTQCRPSPGTVKLGEASLTALKCRQCVIGTRQQPFICRDCSTTNTDTSAAPFTCRRCREGTPATPFTCRRCSQHSPDLDSSPTSDCPTCPTPTIPTSTPTPTGTIGGIVQRRLLNFILCIFVREADLFTLMLYVRYVSQSVLYIQKMLINS